MASKKKQGRKNGDRFSVPGMGQSERMLQKIQNFLEDRDFESMDEANAFLEGITAKLNAGEEPEVDDMSPDKRAQELIYDAWEAKRLLEGRALPKELPEFYAFGSHEEAILYVASFYGGWYRKPDSLLWLARGTAVLLADLCEEDE
ncbi:MAG: hypothetical protein PWQ99_916 [Clostridia bacterium]|nr:hypothetical protein [Clostridia bacterium]MDN5375535.1 hypothetical protein [Thermacetogenium sp.]